MSGHSAYAGNDISSWPDLANASYEGIEESSVQLTDGRWEGDPYSEGGASRPSVGLVEDFVLQGDLDGDGFDELLVALWQSSGGSGTYNYIAVMETVNHAVTNAATAALGDRVQIRGGEISDAAIRLDVVQSGEDDAACCPSQLASRSWTLEGGQLKEHETEVTGNLSLATLEGSEWILERLKQNQHMPPGVEVTLAFSESKVSGNSGCNRFSSGIEDGESPGEVSTGPAMGTRMACPDEQMKLEHEFLDLLGQVTNYGFLGGKLVLSGVGESLAFSMVFKPK